MCEAFLSPLGYTLTSALDGNEALHLIRSREYLPDLVILDVQMPGKTGYEVTQNLTPECPIVFITMALEQVCVELRKEYPEGLPILMVSASSDEESIIKGLQVR